MKKLIAFAGAAGMLLTTVVPVGAFWGDVNNNFAMVNTNVTAKAETGKNYQSNYSFFGGGKNFVMTGAAESGASAIVTTNTNTNSCDWCFSSTTNNNTAFVKTNVVSTANTGKNMQTNMGGGWNTAMTGYAGAGGSAWVVTNANFN